MYKYYFALLVILFTTIRLFAQDRKFAERKTKPKVELGYLYLYNRLNADNYYEYKYSFATDNEQAALGGVNLKLTFPTKYKYLDIITGALFIKGLDEFTIDYGYIDPADVMADDYNFNGGGVYFGISPKLKGKFIGLTSDFGLGVFSFKEYVSIVNNSVKPYVDEHNLKASYGLGAISSVGMYVNVGKIGLNPSLTGIFSGGSGTSFTFYGINFPITYQF